MDFVKIAISIVITVLLLRILMILMEVMQAIFVESFETNLSDSKNFNRYMLNISPKVLKLKVGEGITDSLLLKQTYLSHLKPIPSNSTAKIALYTRELHRYFSREGLIHLNSIPTKFVMSIKNLEMSMPYTVDDLIVLNIAFIRKFPNYINKKYLETLIHEKIHIIQRTNQKKFNEFYKIHYPFLFKSIRLEKLPVKLMENHMTNPDNNFDHWLYKISGKIYVPILEVQDGKLIEYAYEYPTLTNKILLKSVLKYSNTSQSHPNELFAYTVASQIVNGNLDNVFKNFLLTV